MHSYYSIQYTSAYLPHFSAALCVFGSLLKETRRRGRPRSCSCRTLRQIGNVPVFQNMFGIPCDCRMNHGGSKIGERAHGAGERDSKKGIERTKDPRGAKCVLETGRRSDESGTEHIRGFE